MINGVPLIAEVKEFSTGSLGWYLNGKTALAEAAYGKGKIVLFAFRPQHRGQSWGTFPFIFNALEK